MVSPRVLIHFLNRAAQLQRENSRKIYALRRPVERRGIISPVVNCSYTAASCSYIKYISTSSHPDTIFSEEIALYEECISVIIRKILFPCIDIELNLFGGGGGLGKLIA